MILERLFRPRPARAAGAKLYTAVVDQARAPDFYGRLGVPDTVEGRFELYSLHVMLLLDRLKRQGPPAAEVSQAFFDTYVAALDDALREMGVGDLSVGKKMRKLGEAFYGRMAALASGLARNVYESDDAATGDALARYALSSRQRLAEQGFGDLVKGPEWAEIAA